MTQLLICFICNSECFLTVSSLQCLSPSPFKGQRMLLHNFPFSYLQRTETGLFILNFPRGLWLWVLGNFWKGSLQRWCWPQVVQRTVLRDSSAVYSGSRKPERSFWKGLVKTGRQTESYICYGKCCHNEGARKAHRRGTCASFAAGVSGKPSWRRECLFGVLTEEQQWMMLGLNSEEGEGICRDSRSDRPKAQK